MTELKGAAAIAKTVAHGRRKNGRSVIPAQAGIHVDLGLKMDPGLRQDDGIERVGCGLVRLRFSFVPLRVLRGSSCSFRGYSRLSFASFASFALRLCS
jgi:hypothetical protein